MTTYTGRFAPSPTGPLHLGSLVAALGSFLEARAHGGQWLLRIEDIDPPREMPGARDLIPRQLEAHGLLWDGELIYQSHRLDIYQQYLDQLKKDGKVYACDCPRHRIRDLNGVYDGYCRTRQLDFTADSAIRVRLETVVIRWNDLILGGQSFSPVDLGGDFIIRRRDGLVSYQLAVALDDALQDITHVIRGADLLDSTARQIHLHQLLAVPSPKYGHLPMVMNDQGQKLSKQTHAPALDSTRANENLILAMRILGLTPPREINRYPTEDILAWGTTHWDLSLVPTKPVEPY